MSDHVRETLDGSRSGGAPSAMRWRPVEETPYTAGDRRALQTALDAEAARIEQATETMVRRVHAYATASTWRRLWWRLTKGGPA